MNANEELQEWAKKDVDNIADFDQIEKDLETKLEEQMAELQGLEEEREKIGNPDSLGDLMMDVIYDQFVIQLGIDQGEEFKRKNNGLTLDLRDSAHIQTTENFAKGNFPQHNPNKGVYQKRYNDWQENFEKDENGNIIMEKLRFSGKMVERVKDDARKYLNGPSGSSSMPNDHTVPAAEILRDPQANAHLSRDEHRDFAIGEKNYQPLDGGFNSSKRDATMNDALNHERGGKRASERFNINEEELRERDRIAREEYEKQKKRVSNVQKKRANNHRKKKQYNLAKMLLSLY